MLAYKLNPLHYISLPSYSFDCFLKLSKVEIDTIQDEQILKDFISAMRGGICGVMGDRHNRSQNESYSQRSIREHASQMAKHGEASVKPVPGWTRPHDQRSMAKHGRRSIWYIDANNLYGYALMQKLPYKDFEYSNTTLDKVLNTSDDSDYDYWHMCDLEYTNECKERTSSFQLLPHGREVENN